MDKMDSTKKSTEYTALPVKQVEQVPKLCSSRVGLAVIGFFGFVNLYALRVNMSVAMVCMVNHTAVKEMDLETKLYLNQSSGEDNGPSNCYLDKQNNTKTLEDGPFTWPKEIQGIILGAFFWGYLVTQIPGGWLAERFGGKHVFGWFMFACAIANLLTPIGSYASPYLLLALRIVAGLGQGVVFPSMCFMWANWAPPLERSKLIGFTYAGAQIGNVITFPLSGILCDYAGWESIFYVLGGLGVVWFIAWMIIVSDTPAQHKRISPIEKKYIEDAIGTDHGKMQETRKELGTPWRKIFTSLPVWAIIVAHTFANWGTYTLLTNIPTFMKEILKFDIKSNGLFSAIPYIMFWLCINVSGWIADTLRSRGFKTGIVRKIIYCVGSLGPAIFLIGTGFVPCTNPYTAVIILAIATGLCGFQYGSCMVNHVDIAPPFAGVLFGISNTFATLPGILAPYAIAVLTKDSTPSQWQTVFYISAAIYLFGAIFYVIFAQGEIQDWAKPYMLGEDDDDKMESLKVDNSKTTLSELDPPSEYNGKDEKQALSGV